jgi:hypothetical protein
MKIRQLFRFVFLLPLLAFVFAVPGQAQQDLPWQQRGTVQEYNRSADDRAYQEPGEVYDQQRNGIADQQTYGQSDNKSSYDSGYDALRNNGRSPRGYETPRQYNDQQAERRPDATRQYNSQSEYQPPASGGPGRPYSPPAAYDRQYQRNTQRVTAQPDYNDTYSDDEILTAGHRFFGKVTKGLAKVIAHVFKKSGRPNAYILGEEGGGALIAGLRYGEGTIYTKAGDRQRVYWQGPSIGYDFGAEGAKTMILVYHLGDVNDIYRRFGGVDGSAYLVGGIGVTFQKRGRIVLAPIRSGVGVRLGANVGYLKYTRRPTWNPF